MSRIFRLANGDKLSSESIHHVLGGKDYTLKDLIDNQKILWGDGKFVYYMTASHTVTLSENITDQKNGIVLVFCGYSNNQVQKWNMHCYYYPKKLIELGYSGTGNFITLGGSAGISGCKYLYIKNNTIVGNDNNKGEHTWNGVTYSNSSHVLVYVLGV